MGPTYPAAHAAARPIAERFEQKVAATADTTDVTIPDAAAIEQMLTQAFWASLRQEEGRAPRISLAFLPLERAGRPLTFERPLPLEPEALARLAPAVEGPGIHLGVWPNGQEGLSVWGVTRTIPAMCFVLEVVGPGLLVVKYRRRNPLAKYTNVATIEGSDVKFVDHSEAMVADSPALSSLLAFYSSAGRQEADNVLVRMAVAMRAHKRGALLLVVPADTSEWLESVVKPLGYSVNPPYSEISALLQQEQNRAAGLNGALRDAIEAVVGLTTVDGATVISEQMDLLGFGIKIVRRQGAARVEQIVATEPIHGTGAITIEPAQLGGTRHLAAAQFVHDQRNAISLVASQDGRFTVFAWSQVHNMVHAHRMEALLM